MTRGCGHVGVESCEGLEYAIRFSIGHREGGQRVEKVGTYFSTETWAGGDVIVHGGQADDVML